jgi:hypothetical protein
MSRKVARGQAFRAILSFAAMKVAHEGRGEAFPLGTPNKAVAAATARDIYLFPAANG